MEKPKKKKRCKKSSRGGASSFTQPAASSSAAPSSTVASIPCAPGDAAAAAAAAAAVLAAGVVLLPSALPAQFLAELQRGAARVTSEVSAQLDARSIRYRGPGQRPAEPFRFSDVASRAWGRLDVHHGLERAPFDSALLRQNPRWLPVVKRLLGSEDVKLNQVKNTHYLSSLL